MRLKKMLCLPGSGWMLILILMTNGYHSVMYAQEFIPLWEVDGMPNSKGIAVQDSIANDRIYSVGTPGIHTYFPSREENRSGAVLIMPGEGYNHLSYILSGIQIAKWFNVMGLSAFVLDYRLPHSPDLVVRHIAPLQDAQRAIRIIRANAEKWNIDSNKIGAMGVSAGGHLASTLGTHTEDHAKAEDSLDVYSFDPDFLILLSPVISMGEVTHRGSREKLLGDNPSEELIHTYSNEFHVHKWTPPTFLVHAFNDRAVPPENSLLFYQALLDLGVPSSLHIFPQGAHNIILRNNPGSADSWTHLCEQWLKEIGILVSTN